MNFRQENRAPHSSQHGGNNVGVVYACADGQCVVQSPYEVTGNLVDAKLSSFLVNDTPIGVRPGTAVGSYDFAFEVELASGDIALPLSVRPTLRCGKWSPSGKNPCNAYLKAITKISKDCYYWRLLTFMWRSNYERIVNTSA